VERDTAGAAALLAGGSASEVLARILPGDPLGVRSRVTRTLRRRALLLDAERVHLRALARCARWSNDGRGRTPAEWIDASVERAATELTCELEAGERGTEPDVFDALAPPLGLEPAGLRRACARFHGRPARERRALWRVGLEARPPESAGEAGEAEELAAADRALAAVLDALAGGAS
jgi:hypothetical protein